MRGLIRSLVGGGLMTVGLIGITSATEVWQWAVSILFVLPFATLILYSVIEERLEK